MYFENYIISSFLAVASGFIIYVTLVVIKQRWVKTIHHLITYLLLPPVAFVITNVISNNIALSLGMIGALSIVRFRNPVKNPLELVIFFALLTSGISFAVNIKWGIFLVLITISVLLFSKFFELITKKINLFKFSLSFDDSDLTNIVEIESKNSINFLDTNKSLIYSSHITEPKENYIYKLSIKDKMDLENIKEKLKEIREIKSLEIKYFD